MGIAEVKECFFENQKNHDIHWEEEYFPWIIHDHQLDFLSALEVRQNKYKM